jgi:hypothetical protein
MAFTALALWVDWRGAIAAYLLVWAHNISKHRRK